MTTEFSTLFEKFMDENRHLVALVDATPSNPLPNSTTDEKAQPPPAPPVLDAGISTGLVPATGNGAPSSPEGDNPQTPPTKLSIRTRLARYALRVQNFLPVVQLVASFLWSLLVQRGNVQAGLVLLRHFFRHDPGFVVSDRTSTLVAVVGGTLSAPLLFEAAERYHRDDWKPGMPVDLARNTVRGRFIRAIKRSTAYLFLQALVTGLAGSILLLPFMGAVAMDPLHAAAASVVGAAFGIPIVLFSMSFSA